VRLGPLIVACLADHQSRGLKALHAELIDRFGKLPREVNTLMLVRSANQGDVQNVRELPKLTGAPRVVTISSITIKFASPEGLVACIMDLNVGWRKSIENKIVVKTGLENPDADKDQRGFCHRPDLRRSTDRQEKQNQKNKSLTRCEGQVS